MHTIPDAPLFSLSSELSTNTSLSSLFACLCLFFHLLERLITRILAPPSFSPAAAAAPTPGSPALVPPAAASHDCRRPAVSLSPASPAFATNWKYFYYVHPTRELFPIYSENASLKSLFYSRAPWRGGVQEKERERERFGTRILLRSIKKSPGGCCLLYLSVASTASMVFMPVGKALESFHIASWK